MITRILIALACMSTGCFHATPVTPVPVSPAEQLELARALNYRLTEATGDAVAINYDESVWLTSTRWRRDDDSWRDDARPVTFQFVDRVVTIHPQGALFPLCARCSYVLEGRNVIVKRHEGGDFVFRIDEHDAERVTLFWYDLSTYYELSRTSAVPSRALPPPLPPPAP